MFNFKGLFLVILFACLGSACSTVGQVYSASIPNVQVLKDSNIKSAKVGRFIPENEKVSDAKIMMRASEVISPYNQSYASYVGEALKQELILAGKFSASAELEIDGVLIRNNVEASGINVGLADIEARFVIKKNGAILFDKVKKAENKWESSFAGAIAIPKAMQEYPVLIQKLLASLYADPDFVQALK